MAASSLAKQVQELRKLFEARSHADTSPFYLREGEAIPEGVAPERVVFIKRVFIDPSEQPAENLP